MFVCVCILYIIADMTEWCSHLCLIKGVITRTFTLNHYFYIFLWYLFSRREKKLTWDVIVQNPEHLLLLCAMSDEIKSFCWKFCNLIQMLHIIHHLFFLSLCKNYVYNVNYKIYRLSSTRELWQAFELQYLTNLSFLQGKSLFCYLHEFACLVKLGLVSCVARRFEFKK